jgi:hypothetical protein
MSNLMYNAGRFNAATVAAASSGWKVMLVASYTPNKDDSVTTIAGSEIATTTGYTSGFGNRLTPTGLAATAQDDTNDRAGIDADDLVVAAIGVAAGVNASHAVYIREISNDAGSKAYACIELNGGSNLILNGGSLTVTLNARGFAEFA